MRDQVRHEVNRWGTREGGISKEMKELGGTKHGKACERGIKIALVKPKKEGGIEGKK